MGRGGLELPDREVRPARAREVQDQVLAATSSKLVRQRDQLLRATDDNTFAQLRAGRFDALPFSLVHEENLSPIAGYDAAWSPPGRRLLPTQKRQLLGVVVASTRPAVAEPRRQAHAPRPRRCDPQDRTSAAESLQAMRLEIRPVEVDPFVVQEPHEDLDVLFEPRGEVIDGQPIGRQLDRARPRADRQHEPSVRQLGKGSGLASNLSGHSERGARDHGAELDSLRPRGRVSQEDEGVRTRDRVQVRVESVDREMIDRKDGVITELVCRNRKLDHLTCAERSIVRPRADRDSDANLHHFALHA